MSEMTPEERADAVMDHPDFPLLPDDPDIHAIIADAIREAEIAAIDAAMKAVRAAYTTVYPGGRLKAWNVEGNPAVEALHDLKSARVSDGDAQREDPQGLRPEGMPARPRRGDAPLPPPLQEEG